MKFDKAISVLTAGQTAQNQKAICSKVGASSFLVVTVIYIVCLLLIPLSRPSHLIWFAIYPIVLSPLSDYSYSKIFFRSLYVLPFLILIGIFNPLFDTEPAFEIAGVEITKGWLSFFSIIIRGLLAMQALLLLILNTGFIEICNSLRKLGLPKIMTTQLLLLYRYLSILLQEVKTMHNSLISRGYGKKSFPIKFWAKFVGNLFLRTYDRAKRIHQAMLARGFDGSIPTGKNYSWKSGDFTFSLCWCAVFVLLYYFPLSQFFFR